VGADVTRHQLQTNIGLASGLVVYVFGSLTSNPTDPEVLAEWDRRSCDESTAKITVQQTSSA
jgi:hypothetical protein